MDVVDQVLQYAEAGLPVLPLHAIIRGSCSCRVESCTSAAKHPITRHGKDDATTDQGVIAEWLARFPGCNWGVRPPVGVVVLDIDPRNDGDRTLAELEKQHGAIPPTLAARTGSGGRHIWLTYNGPARGKLGQGIDVKTNGGYLVAPPSVHACGGTYAWEDTRPAAYAPQWVKDILNPPRVRRPRLGQGALAPLEGFLLKNREQGDRNRRLYWAACRAVEQGADPHGLLDAAVSIGLAEAEALATIRSAERSAGAGRALPRVQATDDFLKGA